MLFDLPTLEVLAVTLVVTAIRTIAEASPTILGGVAVAAYLRTQLEPKRAQANFPGEGIEGTLRAALIGMTLPVCSIGVLPVLRELRRMGLPTSKLITVGIVAPLLNPFSLLYGLSVLSPPQFLMIVVATGIAAIAIGDVSSRFSIRSQVNADARPAGLTGGTRLRNLLIASSRLVTGQTVVDLLVVIGISTLAASFLRSGAFYYFCEVGNSSGPAIASLLSLPQYVSPSRGVIQFAGIGNANLSIATGLAIYVFGTAISAASLLAISRWYGFQRLLALGLALFFAICAVSYFSFIALPMPIGEVAETSALNGMARPSSSTFSQIAKPLKESLSFFDPLTLLSAAAVSVLFVIGLIVRFSKIEFRNDDPEAAAQQNAGRMSKTIPASQLGAITILGIGGLLLLSVYIFFPAPSTAMKEIETIQLDASIAIRRGDVAAAVDRIAAWDSLAANVPIAAAVRGSFPTYAQRKVTRDLRAELHSTRELLVEGDLNSARKKIADLMRLQSATKDTFAGSSL